MAQPIVHYDGNYVTCYPGSNQTDDGKLNMEFNMTRLVTRVTSKNFCTVKPSYELKQTISNTGKPQIEIGEGQCSINGMDLIMKQKLIIDAPEKPGDYYLIFKLYRDGSNNVKGDDVYGVTRTFMGLYVTYVDEKPDPLEDKDVLYIAKLHYDGNEITDLEEDEDKYGRIWAEDILCKIKDSKHPDITRLLLQDLVYKLPDWYVSKEGDKEYGEIDFMASRLSEGTYGIHLQAKNDNQSEILIKAPILLDTEEDKIIKAFATNVGIELDVGKSKLKSNITNEYALDLQTPNNVIVNSDKEVKLIGKNGISLGTGLNGKDPKLNISNNKILISSDNSNNIESIEFNELTFKHLIGKLLLEYNNNNQVLDIVQYGSNPIKVHPDIDFIDNIRVQNKLYLGTDTFGNDKTYLTNDKFQLAIEGYNTTITPNKIQTKGNGETLITTETTDNKSKSVLSNKGRLSLYNNSANTQILFGDGAEGYNTSIEKTYNANELILKANKIKTTGDITASGDIRANKVYNAVYNDIVEFMEKADYEENIEAGDIVFFNNDGKVTKYHKGINLNAVAGIVSSEDTYGYALGGDGLKDNQKVPVALKGRVYAKTNSMNLIAGDLLGVNLLGELVKVNQYNQLTLGIATQTEKDGKVLVMIK